MALAETAVRMNVEGPMVCKVSVTLIHSALGLRDYRGKVNPQHQSCSR